MSPLEFAPLPDRDVTGVFVIGVEMLASLLARALPVPADVLDVRRTRDGDVVVLLGSDVPGQHVTPIFRRFTSGQIAFDSWAVEQT